MILSEKTKITVTAGVFYSAIVACVVGTAIAANTYSAILNRLDRIAGDSMTHAEFQSWVDAYRESNPTHKVPPVPHKRSDAPHAVAVVSRARNME